MAVWLQRYMLRYWYVRSALDGTVVLDEERDPEEFLFARIGPGGTGKDNGVEKHRGSHRHVLGEDSVRKCAMSNAAARLRGGDTAHALCKLPREDMQQRRGKA